MTNLKTSIDSLKAAILNNPQRPPAQPQTPAQPIPGGQIGSAASVGEDLYAASGGFISGPRGTDTIPAWLSPGEFVINADSTKRFYTQLLTINSGRQPKYFSEGGAVNVGDINVNVNGGETSEKTIREIARGLNRELRRGTFAFQTLQSNSIINTSS